MTDPFRHQRRLLKRSLLPTLLAGGGLTVLLFVMAVVELMSPLLLTCISMITAVVLYAILTRPGGRKH